MSARATHIVWRAFICVAFGLHVAGAAAEPGRIFRCVGPNGEQVFRDQRCGYANLAEAGTKVVPMVRRSLDDSDNEAGCGFESKPMLLSNPVYQAVRLRLVVDIDDEGPYLSIVAAGAYVFSSGQAASVSAQSGIPEPAAVYPGDIDDLSADSADQRLGAVLDAPIAPVDTGVGTQPATFDARVASQGFQLPDGRFIEADWRMGEQRLGFGRSRMRGLLGALSQQPATLVVWFQGFGAPVTVSTMAAEDFRLSVDNLRRCWKTRMPTQRKVPAP